MKPPQSAINDYKLILDPTTPPQASPDAIPLPKKRQPRKCSAPWFAQFRSFEAIYPKGPMREAFKEIEWFCTKRIVRGDHPPVPRKLTIELWWCAQRNLTNLRLVRECIRLGLDLHHTTFRGNNLADCAAAAGCSKTLRALRKAGIKVSHLRYYEKRAREKGDQELLAALGCGR
jgi:hypothetical protein